MGHVIGHVTYLLPTALVWCVQLHSDGSLISFRWFLPLRLASDGVKVVNLSSRIMCPLPVGGETTGEFIREGRGEWHQHQGGGVQGLPLLHLKKEKKS